MRKALFTLVYIFAPIVVAAQQDESSIDNLINPFGASLRGNSYKQNVSVDPYTGTGHVSYSLFGYENVPAGIEHSISLDYDCRGVSVDAIAGDVGLNWSINIGGQIVRSVYGIADDDTNGYRNSGPLKTTGFTIADTATFQAYIKNIQDSQFDIYSYQAGGHSGKFIIGKDGTILKIPISTDKIDILSPVTSVLTGCTTNQFKITIDDGTKYYFNDFNCTACNFSIGVRNASTEWLLTKIVSAYNQDSIVFNYIYNFTSYPAGIYAIQSFYTFDLTGDIGPVKATHNSYGGYGSYSPRLASINYTDGTLINFNYDAMVRLDRGYAQGAINNVMISNGLVSYGYKFNYNYTIRDTSESENSISTSIPYIDYSYLGQTSISENENNYSLMLTDLKRFSGQDTLTGYNFQYYANKLTPRLDSVGVDLWGYNNYANHLDNSRIIHAPYQVAYGSGYYGYLTFWKDGGTRTPKVNYCRAQSLKTITSPTGGQTTFKYELHTTSSWHTNESGKTPHFDSVGGLRIKQIVLSDGTGQNNNRVTSYTYFDSTGVSSSGIMVNPPTFDFDNDFLTSSGGYLYHIRSGMPLNNMVLTRGCPVGYGRVSEFDGTPVTYRAKKVYQFTTAKTIPIPSRLIHDSLPFPYIPDLDFCWGLPISESQYSSFGWRKSGKSYKYKISIDSFNNSNFNCFKVAQDAYSDIWHPTLDWYVSNISYPITGLAYNTEIDDTTYFPNNTFVSKVTHNTFDSIHHVLVSQSVPNALGEMITTKFFYPYQFTSGAPVATLHNMNLDYQPVRIEKWRSLTNDSELLDVQEGDLNFFNSVVHPSSIYDFTPEQTVLTSNWGAFDASEPVKGLQYMKKRETIDAYDSIGNPIQLTYKGITSSQLWSYNHRYAVAKVINASLADVAYTSFETDDLGGWQTYGTHDSLIAPGITGNKSCHFLNNHYYYRTGLNSTKKYILSFWTNGGLPSISVSGPAGFTTVTPNFIAIHRGWSLYKIELPPCFGVYLLSGSNSLKIDELRLYPLGSAMTTGTYTPLYGITSTCDASDHIIYTEYDSFGRVKCKRDMDGLILQTYDYKFQQPQ